MLSDKDYSVPKLADIFFTRTHTIRGWFNRWLSDGIQGLGIRPGRGLKPTIREEDTALVTSIKEEVSLDPHNLKQVVEKLNAKWDTTLTVRHQKVFIKKTELQLATFSCVYQAMSGSVHL